MRCIEMLKKYAQHAKIGRLTLTWDVLKYKGAIDWDNV